ncbi:unnamed protein product [Chilo suppressalis]|uniref:NADH dehydrogenase (Ubiquinone) complex I, assembly factor 6 n=1 Tax=Chilo suppressalis TaxID=168631 RepID=A0ABN8LAC3_CHISP|nr:unnamed protein product [Chilo suppressalis]
MKLNKAFNQIISSYKLPTVLSRPMSTNNLSNQNALNYCAKIVRQHDYENFLATLLMTKSIRSPALVVRAFNVEVARIQDQTTDPQTAAFRLQFWQDVLTKIYKKETALQNIPANPVAQELYKICNCYSLQRKHLERLISSRSNLLKSRFFRSLEDIEGYAEDAVSPTYYLLLKVADVKDLHADHAASHLGKAQGIANILRSIFVFNRHKMISLPMDILMANEVSQEQVLRGADSEKLRNVTFEIATRANSHLQKARKIKVPKIANQIFLPAISVDKYLTNLQKCNFNLFDTSLQRQNATLPFNLYYNRIINNY